MKTLLSMLFIFSLLLITSCSKDDYPTKTVVPGKVNTSLKAEEKCPPGCICVTLGFKAGHAGPGPSCFFPNYGDVKVQGFNPAMWEWVHVPCAYTGSYCDWTLQVVIPLFKNGSTSNEDLFLGKLELGKTYEATVVLTQDMGINEKTFPMPSRSCLMKGDVGVSVSTAEPGVYANLQEQIWERIQDADNGNPQYRLTRGIEFNKKPYYLNAE